MRLAVCPHDTEFPQYKRYWDNFCQNLSEFLSEKIYFEPFKDYIDEREKLKTEQFDIYYANPVIALKLYQRGYKPVAKFKDENDTFIVIGNPRNLQKKHISIATVYLESHIIPLLDIQEFNFLNSDVKYLHKQSDIYEMLKNGKCDVGIIYGKDYKLLDGITVLKKVNTKLSHFLMVKPKYYGKIRGFLKDKKAFELVDENYLKDSLEVSLSLNSVLKIKEFFDISKALYNIPFVGILIYKDKITYANKNLQNMLGYTEDELLNLKPEEIVSDELRKKIRKVVQRRLKGEYFSSFYENLKLKSKNGISIYTMAFSNTIYYNDGYAGIVLFINITEEIRYKRLFRALSLINKAMIGVLTEKELFNAICKTLVDELGIKFVWVAKKLDRINRFEPLCSYGKNKDYLEHLNDNKDKKGQTYLAFKTKDIVINPDTRTTPFVEAWREEMLKRKFLSSAVIPVGKNDEILATINIYSTEPYFFDEENRSLLEELRKDINFTLEKIERIRNSVILTKAVENSDEWVLITDDKGNIEYLNDFVLKLTGYSREELIGRTPRIFKSGYHPPEFYKKLWDTILANRGFEAVFVNRKKNGELIYIEEKIIPVNLPDGSKKFISLGRDITKEKKLEEELEKARYYDLLTGLYNYNGLKFKTEEFISKHNSKRIVLLIIDIDNFTIINRKYGREFGDKLLKDVANRIRKLRQDDFICARVGPDEIAILKTAKKYKSLAIFITKIRETLEKPFNIDGHNIDISLNIGVAIYPQDAETFSKLYDNAYIALKNAKKDNHKNIEYYNKELEKDIGKYLEVEKLIKEALRDKLFVFYYQPYFDAKTLKIAGLEALIRIKDKKGYIHFPNEFVDFLENSIYLEQFEKWALNEISKKINELNLPISLNISAKTFRNPEFLKQLLKCGKGLKKYINIEITERLFMEDIEKTKEVIQSLGKYETIKISIDDFGTGYSSLLYLTELNVDFLKIDISFVRKLEKDIKTREIVKVIIDIAKVLRMKTVAEGVETETQYKILKDFGVNYIQGYFLEKPISEEELKRKYFKYR